MNMWASGRKGARDAPRPHLPGSHLRGSHLVASAVVQILVVVLMLTGLLLVTARSASSAAAASRRANVASSIAANIADVSQADTALESAFEGAASVPDVGARVAQFSTASATALAGTGAYSTYVQRSLHLPHEVAARRAYETANDAWGALGAKFGPILVNPGTSADAIATTIGRLRVLQAAREERLAALRGLYLAEAGKQESFVARTQRDLASTETRGIVVVAVFGIVLMVVAGRRAARRTRERDRVERDRATAARRTDFEARLQRSMALAVDESAVVESISHTLDVVGYSGAELLMADFDGGEFTRAITPHAGTGCGVERASDCPAMRLRQRLDFADPDAIDACPFLRARHTDVGECACVPVTIADRMLAVLRAEAPPNEHLTAEQADWIAIMARNTGEKVSALRAFARSQQQAATDPLTGLANRRSLEHAIGTFINSPTYAVVFADIDHFKDLNDTFGHEVGDACLQAIARVLERATRPGDLCARYGGDEFVVLLPDASTSAAEGIAQRVQTLLAEELVSSHLAPFTVSMGIASTDRGAVIDEVIRVGDHAMFEAKAAGRNRIVSEFV
jgi:diguanylate cyclase (GGDEF)-like protein